jgi:uncharacterized protein
MISRQLTPSLRKAAQSLPVVAVLGPRQSGKTTLVRDTFASYRYVSLEDRDARKFALEDPRGFLRAHHNEQGIILDEFQQVPEILSYIQTYVDEYQRPGYFILTGSQNFLLNQAITQTLAGRIALLTLLPLSIAELKHNHRLQAQMEELVLKGEYPRIYAQSLDPVTWYRDYIQTYLERDVRSITNITDLTRFQDFVQLCAGRIGQLVNISSLANDAGVDVRTAKSWLSLLEASYLMFTLQPHHKNFSKRLIKSPKIYFYDTGLACSLLGIESEAQLRSHYLRGGLVENLIISELMKNYYNLNRKPRLYFWRDSTGHEIDCLIEQAERLIPIEIKAGMTINSDFFDGLSYWHTLTEGVYPRGYVVYGGLQNQERSLGTVVSWQNLEAITSVV